MKLPRLPLFVGLLLLPLWLAAAPGAVRKGAVTAELVAAQSSIQPGKSFLVALKLTHDTHWHSYWINPGTGYPTSLKWKLPAGFTAGPILWPTPHVVQDKRGRITGHGYEGEVFLFVELTAPASLKPGEDVTLRATADWLMCEDVCMPGRAELELTLPVGAGSAATNPALVQAYANLPLRSKGWTATASRTDKIFTLRLTPVSGTTHRPQALHFFDTAGLIDYAAAQTVTEENGSSVLTMAVSKEAPADATSLTGVLASTNGWAAGHGYRGLIIDGARPAPAATPLLGTLLLALVGGLILNLMPCVFPVLGIKVLGFVNQSGSDRRKVITHGLTFTFGVLLSFWVLAAVLLLLRAGGEKLGWGAQLQYAGFDFGLAAFLLIFALNLSGLFEVGLSATGVGGKLQMRQGYAGSFFTGALAVLVATPCSAPFLAPALGVAFSSSLSPLESMLIFTCIGAGLSAPYLLLSIFPGAVKMLPRPGAWMETFKQFMAFLLYATVGWLLWVLAGLLKANYYGLLFVLFGLTLIAMATWVYGRFHQALGRITAVLLLVGGLALGWPKTEEKAPVTASGYAVKWEEWSPSAVEAARAAGRTIYVDFTARWCFTCQTNKVAVFSSDAVLAEFGRRNVLLLRGDWTGRDPRITEELEKWQRSAVPFNLIYAPGRTEPVVLPELLTPGRVLEALATAPAK